MSDCLRTAYALTRETDPVESVQCCKINGALSATLGGVVSLSAGLAFAVVASLGKPRSMEGALLGALRAEAVKVGLVVFLLWLVFALYQDIVALAFIGSFTVTILIFAMAFFVRDV